MGLKPVASSNSYGQNLGQLNDMVRQLNQEQKVKTFNGPTGEPAITIGRIGDGTYGIKFSDGTVTTTITASSIIQNDGTNDRLFLGNE